MTFKNTLLRKKYFSKIFFLGQTHATDITFLPTSHLEYHTVVVFYAEH